MMTDVNGRPLTAELHGCMYVPGLSRRPFSITKFASNVIELQSPKMQLPYFSDNERARLLYPYAMELILQLMFIYSGDHLFQVAIEPLGLV
jgi:hypothetical protein